MASFVGFDDPSSLDPVDSGLEVPPPPGAGAAPVVGGEPVGDGVWPDTAALFTIGGQFACSGVLVAPDLVLTAGHCGYGIGRVVVGTADHASGGETRNVVDNLVHEDYLQTLDAAVLRLDVPVTDVPPRVLARDCVVEDDLFAGAPVAIVGFGALDEFATEWSSVLHQADTTVGDPECVDLDAGCNEDVSPGGELIAGGDGIDSCSGDSGGPLYLLTSDDPAGDYLVGITSRASTPAHTVCGDGGIYVRADAIADWIEGDLGIPLPRPDCGGNTAPDPRADSIVAVVDLTDTVSIDPNDPDPGQGWSFDVIAPPAHGVAVVSDDGRLTYDAVDAPPGYDAVTVAVTDDGSPPRVGRVTIPIHVLPVPPGTKLDPGGCGCDGSSAGTGGLGLLLSALWTLRRPRRRDRRPPGR